MKRAIIFLLVIILALSSCGKAEPEPIADIDNTNQDDAADIETETRFVKTTVKPIGDVYSSEEYSEYDGTIYNISYESPMVTVKSVYPESKTVYEYECASNPDIYFRGLGACEDGIWILRDASIIKVSYDGELLLDIALDNTSEIPNGNFSYDSLAVDGEGYAYALWGVRETRIAIISPDGNVEYIEFDGYAADLLTTSDKKVIVYDDLTGICYLNREDLSMGEFISIPSYGNPDNSGLAANGFNGGAAALCDETGIYSLDASGNVEAFILWSEQMLSSTVAYGIIPLKTGEYFFWDRGGGYILTPKTVVAGKITLTLAMFGVDNYISCVNEFNNVSERYYIDVVDYCEGERSLTDALTIMNTQLIAGTGPDIILFDNRFSQNAYASKGWLYDLYDFMDNDISREDILFSDLMETNGGLYALSPNFFIETWYSFDSSLSGKTGWSYDDYLKMAKSLKSGYAMTPISEASDFLSNALSGYIPTAVDWSRASCNFDSAEFADLLNLSVNAAKNITELSEADLMNMYQDNKFMLMYTLLYSPENIANIESSYNAEANFVGFPTPDGSCGSILCFSERFGISSQCKTPKGAWELIKYVMTSEYAAKDMQMFTAPTLKSALDEEIYSLLNPAEGKPTVTGEQVDKFYEILDSVTLVAAGEPMIRDIIMNEAQAFFTGGKTAEETAKLIQSRVHIYMSEMS